MVQNKGHHVLDHLLKILVDLPCRIQHSIGQGTAMEEADLESNYLVEIVHQRLSSDTPVSSHLKAY